MRMFRLRTLAGSNVAGLLLGGAVFSQFFLLTLYMQQVLHYSAMQTGVAYITLTFAVIVFANVAQALSLRLGIRRVLPVGLLLSAVALVLYARLPVDGHYFWDLFPGFLIGGIGMALGFIPLTIGALAGVRHDEAGVASGLVNTGQQIGGAIGVAAATTIAATSTSNYLGVHPGARRPAVRRSPTASRSPSTPSRRSRRWARCSAAVVIESEPPVAAAEADLGEELALEAAA